jgi:hypothetical protein
MKITLLKSTFTNQNPGFSVSAMDSFIRFRFLPIIPLLLLTAWPDGVNATQAHGQPEGIYAHQLAHIFFLISMAALAYWLKARNLTVETGWRYIQISAILFLIWNVDAFCVHFLGEQLQAVTVIPQGGWKVQIATAESNAILSWLYYILKLDHLLCVPAMVFLYMGLRRLITTVGQGVENKGTMT